ncbi:MAG: hypothetical protein FD174_974 [Geobacteraceae bacterium]|nr:MAG: hypothetical protein FD174_974 [Geobacteraceae bacterium]
MQVLEELEGKYRLIHAKLAGIDPDEFDYVGLAYTIVNLYNLMENYCLRIAKYFEYNVDTLNWHKDLIKRMALEIDGIRPALLQSKDVPLIDELRAFRHVFRHIYQSELDVEKLKLVDSRTPKALDVFKSAHGRFIGNLQELIDMLDA